MFTILGEFATLLFLRLFGSNSDRQELAECIQRNNNSLEQIHLQYQTLDAQMAASTTCMLRQVDEIFSQVCSDYRDELKTQKALRGLG